MNLSSKTILNSAALALCSVSAFAVPQTEQTFHGIDGEPLMECNQEATQNSDEPQAFELKINEVSIDQINLGTQDTGERPPVLIKGK